MPDTDTTLTARVAALVCATSVCPVDHHAAGEFCFRGHEVATALMAAGVRPVDHTALQRARAEAMDWVHGVDRPGGLDGRFAGPLGLVRGLIVTAERRIAEVEAERDEYRRRADLAEAQANQARSRVGVEADWFTRIGAPDGAPDGAPESPAGPADSSRTVSEDCGACYMCLWDKPAYPGAWVTIGMTRMIVCPECGNKRCPHGTDHRLACTGSNEPGQEGSRYA